MGGDDDDVRTKFELKSSVRFAILQKVERTVSDVSHCVTKRRCCQKFHDKGYTGWFAMSFPAGVREGIT